MENCQGKESDPNADIYIVVSHIMDVGRNSGIWDKIIENSLLSVKLRRLLMRIAIFGTGKIFYRYWKYIDKECIVCLMDNNEEKIGKYIEGIEIISPTQLKVSDCDIVLILCKSYDEMKFQLVEAGIPENMIYNYLQIGNITKKTEWVYDNSTKRSFDDWFKANDNKRILLISHELSYTGAPIALMNMAIVMQKMGFSVIYAGMNDASLKKELEINHLDYVLNWIFIDGDRQKEYIRNFDLVVICTFGMKGLIEGYKDVEIPIIWWIHEAEVGYQEVEYLNIGKNVSVFCGGKYAQRAFQKHCKVEYAQILQYCIPEEELFTEEIGILEREKITFGLIGAISERKAQDILLKAALKLPIEYREKIQIILIGAVIEIEQGYWEKQKVLLEQLENVKIIGEISQKELAEKYKEIDVLVCPSRDDPMPVVVTQGMMYGKPCILSKNVGQVEFIEPGVNGFIFEGEDELAEQMKWIVNHKENLYNIGKCARRIYEQNFSETIMKRQIKELWEHICE